MSTVQGAIEAIQDVAAAMSGIKAAPDYATESLNVYPIAITYSFDGDCEGSDATALQSLDNIVCEIHVPRNYLPADLKLLMPYIDTFRNDLWADPLLGGAVTSLNGVRHQVLALNYAGVETLALRFTIKVKLRNAIT